MVHGSAQLEASLATQRQLLNADQNAAVTLELASDSGVRDVVRLARAWVGRARFNTEHVLVPGRHLRHGATGRQSTKKPRVRHEHHRRKMGEGVAASQR